jgi:hypothetical protein
MRERMHGLKKLMVTRPAKEKRGGGPDLLKKRGGLLLQTQRNSRFKKSLIF